MTSYMPELSSLGRRAIAKLVGLAPPNSRLRTDARPASDHLLTEIGGFDETISGNFDLLPSAVGILDLLPCGVSIL